MARFREILYGSEQSNTEDYELQCYLNSYDEIFITIDCGGRYEEHIVLDKSTAIKLSKILRREINKIGEEEQNG